jgi:hypothetical protein
MLEIAAQKVPEARLVHGDMTGHPRRNVRCRPLRLRLDQSPPALRRVGGGLRSCA